jgi:hypothetical protein
VTLFRESAALANAENWLVELHNTSREGDLAQQYALDQVKAAFAADLFPQPTTLHLTARNALLQIGESPCPVPGSE